MGSFEMDDTEASLSLPAYGLAMGPNADETWCVTSMINRNGSDAFSCSANAPDNLKRLCWCSSPDPPSSPPPGVHGFPPSPPITAVGHDHVSYQLVSNGT